VNGKPTNAPSQVGEWVIDSRSDRGIIWAATGPTANDWQIFGSRPIEKHLDRPRDDSYEGEWFYASDWASENVMPDFVGQLLCIITHPDPDTPSWGRYTEYYLLIAITPGPTPYWDWIRSERVYE
jgi:hypothetical protein